jgi:transcriptional regulator with XRE-family HTH domain
VIGQDVKAWRVRTGYTQKELQLELGFKSRTSVSSLENQTTPIDRTVELALAALELAPVLRRQDVAGRKPWGTHVYPAISENAVRSIYVDGPKILQL